MPERDWIVDPETLDFTRVVAAGPELERWVPQRGPMAQLDAIILDDAERRVCVGYRDLTATEFWVAGHMPAMPLMPGVLMCEAAAQVCTYHAQRHDLLQSELMGFGGLDGVRFRGYVLPGDRLTVACHVLKHRPKRMVVCRFEGFVGSRLVCEGELHGVPLPVAELSRGGR
jgi:3-hydroxyacyl-[acyl-carrier-protein] dehydratase